MTFSLTKRQFIEEENDEAQRKRINKPDNYPLKRPSVFPHLEVSVEELIRMSGKTSFTPEEVQNIALIAVRNNQSRIREEYEKILNDKLKEQNEVFEAYQRQYLEKQYSIQEMPYYL
ncbi:hypothetical protein EDI_253010 [Entamoeba dispar SAW760]|uniref:Uncharacterized protein n=1 Tax=Entamoeba dispar (strain ATCC PRA-260 / SAW760) TaxID=370354 RepID=B0EFA6_ENTDS|nr:uncharacterized protein EDI_253010 [Entamoeba dispar SAW760]EDR26836.1 hypothetical protein EDI_253010 [Entamoeba dispar SAW760]|eukprot:EDR26836.1 hypothetical protein EDI_253010 [Entamoeba dispar SAW760]